MARAIDADALQEMCNRRIQDTWNSGTAPVSWAEAYAEFKDDIDSIPTLTPPNEPLTCEGCIHEHNEHENCNYCKRASYLDDYYYRRPPEGDEDTWK